MIKHIGFRKIWVILIIVGFFAFIFLNIYNDKRKHNLFYTSKINSKIIKVKGNWSGGRSYSYVTEENISITLSNDRKLLPGDSISKKASTEVFEAFRLNSLDNKYYPIKE
jgi:hypothetical protein